MRILSREVISVRRLVAPPFRCAGRRRLAGLLLVLPIVLAVATAAPRTAMALDRTQWMSQYVMRHWQTEHGLPAQAIYALTQTPDGYLWIGTEEGVARFDGATFKVFDKTNTPALA